MPILDMVRPEVLDLKVMKFRAAAMLDRELFLHSPETIEFIQRDLPESMGRQLIAQLKVPAQVLQENRLIHRSPATAWDHVKQRLLVHVPVLKRWLRPVLYVEVRLSEHLIYPTVRVPHDHADRVRLYVAPTFDTAFE